MGGIMDYKARFYSISPTDRYIQWLRCWRGERIIRACANSDQHSHYPNTDQYLFEIIEHFYLLDFVTITLKT
ncbi:MAG: hypothetical protein QM730_21425 [Anaerolineales bacterium]